MVVAADFLKPIYGLRPLTCERHLLVVLWDPHRPPHPAPERSEIEGLLLAGSASLLSWFRTNSLGRLQVRLLDVLGWFDADEPPDYYWRVGEFAPPTDPTHPNYYVDAGGTRRYLDQYGFHSGHARSYVEAIEKAAVSFSFGQADLDSDGKIATDELVVLIVKPQRSRHGFTREVVGRQVPLEQGLNVDGVKITAVTEWYTGLPPVVATATHELCHLLLNAGDMYPYHHEYVPEWSDEQGWDDVANYSTIQTAVVNNTLFLLGRADRGIHMWRFDVDDGWTRVAYNKPTREGQTRSVWSDDAGAGVISAYSTMVAVSVEGRLQVVGRTPAGVNTWVFENADWTEIESPLYFAGRPGPYSIMDSDPPGGHLDPFHKLKLGWLNPRLAEQNGIYMLQPVEDTGDAIIVHNQSIGPKEYFIVENRSRSSQHDVNLPSSGLAVWHVVEDPKLSNNWGRRAVRLRSARPRTQRADPLVLFDGSISGRGYDLDDDSSPQNLRFRFGRPSGLAIRKISAAGGIMSLEIDGVEAESATSP